MVCVLAPFNYILHATYLSPWCRWHQTVVRSAAMVRCGTGVIKRILHICSQIVGAHSLQDTRDGVGT